MQNPNDLLSNPLLAAHAAAAYGNGASLSSILAYLSHRQPQHPGAPSRVLQDSTMATSVGEYPNWLSALCVRPNLADLLPSHNHNDPLLLASAVAARRQEELTEVARREVLMNEAYKRGRDEALVSLVRLGGVEGARRALPPPAAVAGLPPTVQDEVALEQIGSTCMERRKLNTPYVDASAWNDPNPQRLANRRARGGVTEPFPEKLHRMLCEVEETDENVIISWFSHGRAFAVHNPARFVADVLPKYFRQSRLSSFQRQLNLYGFTRITQGPDAGGYYHELFLKGRPNLCLHMRRVGVPQGHAKQALKAALNEPDFYAMTPVLQKKSHLEVQRSGDSAKGA